MKIEIKISRRFRRELTQLAWDFVGLLLVLIFLFTIWPFVYP